MVLLACAASKHMELKERNASPQRLSNAEWGKSFVNVS